MSAVSYPPALSAGWAPEQAIPMSEKYAEKAKNNVVKMYAVGILVFSGFFGFITLLALFLRHLK
jgi:hypothetical protein